MVRKLHINITNQPCNSKLVPNIQTCQLCYDEFFKNIWQIWTIFCTTESIHCHPFNFWISFQFAHRIYQGQKSSFGAKSGAHSKTWELETKGMSYLVVTQYCKTIIRPILSFQKGQQNCHLFMVHKLPFFPYKAQLSPIKNNLPSYSRAICGPDIEFVTDKRTLSV